MSEPSFDTGTWILADTSGLVVDQSGLARLRFGEAFGCPCRELVRATTPDGKPHCTDHCFAGLPEQAIRSRVVRVDGEPVRLTCARDAAGLTIHIDAEYWDGGPPLTAEERAVLQAVADGSTPREIASAQSISVVDVHDALSTARLKLQADSVLQAVVRAILSGQLGLCSPGDP